MFAVLAAFGCSDKNVRREEVLKSINLLKQSWSVDREKTARYVLTVVSELNYESPYEGEDVFNEGYDFFNELKLINHVHSVREALRQKEKLLDAILKAGGDDEDSVERGLLLYADFLSEIKEQCEQNLVRIQARKEPLSQGAVVPPSNVSADRVSGIRTSVRIINGNDARETEYFRSQFEFLMKCSFDNAYWSKRLHKIPEPRRTKVINYIENKIGRRMKWRK